MESELYRVETVLSALNTGITSEWSEAQVGQHGFEGRREPLAFALDHLLAYPARGSFMLAQFLLSGQLQKLKVCKSQDSTDIAAEALNYWLVGICPSCQGTGVMSIHQEPCIGCDGKGRAAMPNDAVRQAISIINANMECMERRLRNHLI